MRRSWCSRAGESFEVQLLSGLASVCVCGQASTVESAMFTILPGKRRWQKLKDLDCGKRLREETFGDRTHLLRRHVRNPDEIPEGSYILASGRDGEEVRDAPQSEPWIAHMDKSYILAPGRDGQELRDAQKSIAHIDKTLTAPGLSTVDRLPKDPVAVDGSPAASVNLACCSSSCRSFKKLLRKPFMPFSSRKGAPDELQHLRQKEVEWVSDSSNENANVLTSRTNVLELGKMDTNIQDGINKSTFLRKSKFKEDLQPSQKQNLKIVAANKGKSLSGLSVVSMKVQAQFRQKAYKENVEQHTNPPKENVILRKLLQRSQKGQALLLEDGGLW